MSYRAVKCWWCGQIPHPLDYDHALWCAPTRNYIGAITHEAEALGDKGDA